MEVNREVKPQKLVLKVAVVYALYTLLITYIMYFLGYDAQDQRVSAGIKALFTALSYLPLLLAIFWIQKTIRDDSGGYITFGTAFSLGFKIAVLSGLFIGILLILYYKVFNIAAFHHLITAIEDQTENKFGDDEQAVKVVSTMKSYFPIMLFFGSIFGMLITGSVISLIGAAIFKKDPPFFMPKEEVLEG